MTMPDQSTSSFGTPVWSADGSVETPPTPPRRSGCATCLIISCVLLLICFVLCGVGGWFVVKKAPDWARNAVVSSIEASELKAEDKRIVIEQVDRVVAEYKAGRVTTEQMGKMVEELSESPLITLMITMAAMETYVKPSGLSEEEKVAAKRTLERVARGVIEDQITQEDLDTALDFVSTEDANGTRKFQQPVADEKIRQMLAELLRVADEAQIPDEPYEVNVGEEFKGVVDRVLKTP